MLLSPSVTALEEMNRKGPQSGDDVLDKVVQGFYKRNSRMQKLQGLGCIHKPTCLHPSHMFHPSSSAGP
jgi:hypothetical protein